MVQECEIEGAIAIGSPWYVDVRTPSEVEHLCTISIDPVTEEHFGD